MFFFAQAISLYPKNYQNTTTNSAEIVYLERKNNLVPFPQKIVFPVSHFSCSFIHSGHCPARCFLWCNDTGGIIKQSLNGIGQRNRASCYVPATVNSEVFTCSLFGIIKTVVAVSKDDHKFILSGIQNVQALESGVYSGMPV